MPVHACKPSAGNKETGGSLALDGQPVHLNHGVVCSVTDPDSEKEMEKLKMILSVDLWPHTSMYMYTHTHTNRHTQEPKVLPLM